MKKDISGSYKGQHVSYHTLYIQSIYPVILKIAN